MNDIETKKAFKRKHVLVDVVVEADLSGMTWTRRGDTEEEKAKDLERAVKDFHEFLRDHRSQDMVSLNVERKYKDLCSNCGKDEFDYEVGKTTCAWCGAIIEDKKDAQTKECSGHNLGDMVGIENPLGWKE